MAKGTLILLFSLVFSLSIQSVFSARFDESMNDLKEKMYDGAKTVKDSAMNMGETVKEKAKHFMYAPETAPAYAPHKAKHHKAHAPGKEKHAHAPDISGKEKHTAANAPHTARHLQYNIDDMYKSAHHDASTNGHNVVLHASKNPRYSDVTGDTTTAFKNWAYAPHPAAAPMTDKASHMYNSAAGAVKDTGKKLHNKIHASMTDVLPRSAKHRFDDVTGDATRTFKNWAKAPTPAAGPTVHSVSNAANKKIHNTIHMALKDAKEILPNTANPRFSDVTGHWAYAPSQSPRPSTVSNAASKRIRNTIHTAMNGNSHMASPRTTYSDATGKTPVNWANSPSPVSGPVAGNLVSNAAAHKIRNTIHTAVTDTFYTPKPRFDDATGSSQTSSSNRWAYSGSPSINYVNGHATKWAHTPSPSAGAKRLHNTIHAAMNDIPKEIFAPKGKHPYNDITGPEQVVINDIAHAPSPAHHAAAPAKHHGKKIHNTIHAAMNEKAREFFPNTANTQKHRYNDKTGENTEVISDFAHAPAPARHAAAPAKHHGKKIHNTIHTAMNVKEKHHYNDITGVNPEVISDFAHAPAPARHAAAPAKHHGKKIHNTIHAAMNEKAKHHYNDMTGENPEVMSNFAHAPTPAHHATAPAKHHGKKLHSTIHTAMNEKAKHHYNDMTGENSEVTTDFAHAPTPAPHAATPSKRHGKKMHSRIHASMYEKARGFFPNTGKHHFNDVTGQGSVTNDYARAPTPASHTAGKKLHGTVHTFMQGNLGSNADAAAGAGGSNALFKDWAKNWLGGVEGHGHQHFPTHQSMFHNPWMGGGMGAGGAGAPLPA